jgi:hypothetical protein
MFAEIVMRQALGADKITASTPKPRRKPAATRYQIVVDYGTSNSKPNVLEAQGRFDVALNNGAKVNIPGPPLRA